MFVTLIISYVYKFKFKNADPYILTSFTSLAVPALIRCGLNLTNYGYAYNYIMNNQNIATVGMVQRWYSQEHRQLEIASILTFTVLVCIRNISFFIIIARWLITL